MRDFDHAYAFQFSTNVISPHFHATLSSAQNGPSFLRCSNHRRWPLSKSSNLPQPEHILRQIHNSGLNPRHISSKSWRQGHNLQKSPKRLCSTLNYRPHSQHPADPRPHRSSRHHQRRNILIQTISYHKKRRHDFRSYDNGIDRTI
jgi:hypothetical protein